MKTLMLAISFFLFFHLPLLAEDVREPFESIFPSEEEEVQPVREPEPVDIRRQINLEGVIWGTDRPQAIVDGQVYSVGDSLEGFDATIVEIKENVVFISHGDRVLQKTTQKSK